MVSIIMPSYNRGYIISRAIESVIKQTYSEYELLIVDDGSDDDTKEIIQGYLSDKIVFYSYDENRGACYARNYGLKRAHGEYLAFLDTDNEWKPTFLEERIRQIKHSNSDLVFGRIYMHSIDKIWPFDDKDVLSERTSLKERLLYENVIDTNSVLMNRKCYEVVGEYDISLERFQDWEYFSRIVMTDKLDVSFQDDCLVNYYSLNDSISNKTHLYWKSRYAIMKKIMEDACSVDRICGLFSYFDDIVSEFYEGFNKYEFAESLGIDMVVKLIEYILEYKERSELLINREKRINSLQHKIILNKIQGKNIKDYFISNKYSNIFIHGFATLGKELFSELSIDNFKITVIEKNESLHLLNTGVKFYSDYSKAESEGFPDVIVITAVNDFEVIKSSIEIKCPIISLEDIVEAISI